MERKQITVKTMVEPRHFTSNGKDLTSYAFMGEDGQKYETISSTIAGYFVVGKVLDCEIEDKSWQTASASGVNHSIKQLFVDGQPVSGQGKGPGRSAYTGRTSEDRNSIESQCAAKIVCELVIAGKATPEQSTALNNWLLPRLTGEATSAAAPKSTPQSGMTSKPAAAPGTQPSGTSLAKVNPATLKVLDEWLEKTVTPLAALGAEIVKRGWVAKAKKDLTQLQAEQLIQWLQAKLKLDPEPGDDIPF